MMTKRSSSGLENEGPRGAPARVGPDGGGAVEVTRVERAYGGERVLRGVDLQVQAGEFFSILGPSGCGKTTLLRILAGLEESDAGGVRIAGREMSGVPAHLRPVNTVFQSYALFPHLTVAENVAFGLRMKRVPVAERVRRVGEALELVSIGELARRRPSQLSGGERQRTALARALVNEPKVLLLDEPLAALDLKLRRELQQELRRLQRRLGTTFIFVTHDQDEALSLSDRLAVMRAGQVEQTGSPEQVYDRPANRFIAEFLGSCNVVEVMAGRPEGKLETELGWMTVAAALPGSGVQAVGIRPERVRLGTEAPAENGVPGVVESVIFAGAAWEVWIAAGKARIRATVGFDRWNPAQVRPGVRLWMEWPSDALLPFGGEGSNIG